MLTARIAACRQRAEGRKQKIMNLRQNKERIQEILAITGLKPTDFADLVRVAQLIYDPSGGVSGKVVGVNWLNFGISRDVAINLRSLDRVEREKQLLKHKNETIADIALQCGFTNQSSFTRLFRKMTGVTPKTYSNNYAVGVFSNNQF